MSENLAFVPGKSTLLNMIGTIDLPTTGTVELMGESIDARSSDKHLVSTFFLHPYLLALVALLLRQDCKFTLILDIKFHLYWISFFALFINLTSAQALLLPLCVIISFLPPQTLAKATVIFRLLWAVALLFCLAFFLMDVTHSKIFVIQPMAGFLLVFLPFSHSPNCVSQRSGLCSKRST